MKKLTMYLILSFGFSIIGGLVIYFGNLMPNKELTLLGTAIVALFIMPAPAYSVIIIEKFDFKKIIADYNVNLNKHVLIDTLKITIIFLLSISILFLLIVYLISLFNSELGHLSSVTELNETWLNILKSKGAKASKPLGLTPIVLLIVGILGSLFAGFTINGLFAFGEELGWRGLMDKELGHFSFLKKNLIIGTIWGLWHSPMIVQGFNFPNYPLIGCLFMCFLCISMSFVFSYAKQLSDSTITPSILHGAFNALATILAFLVITSNIFIGSILGLAGIVAILLTYLSIKLFLKYPLAQSFN